MSMIGDFKKFALRGNVVDMAVGVIIGGSFGKIVTSFVNDVLMPPIGMLMGQVDFSNIFINLSEKSAETLAEARDAGLPVIAVGTFANTVIDFIIQAFVIFMMVRWITRLSPPPVPAPEPETKECPLCFSKIDARATRCPHCSGDLS